MRSEIFALIVLVIIALVSFLGIIAEINKKYGAEFPTYGGTVREGVIGNPRFMNPILAQSDADRDIVSLVYTGLFRYDRSGSLMPVLIENLVISPDGLEYAVKLKEKLFWQDGKKITVDDIIFTIGLAKNPLVGSPRRPNWEGVEVEKTDERTLKFHLKKAYAPFLENLTLGILPQHIWSKIPPSQMALAELNTDPVGAGPYYIKSVGRDSLGSVISVKLSANKYFALGRPHIKTIVLQFFQDEDAVIKNLLSRQISAFGATSPKNTADLENLGLKITSIRLRRIIAAFLNPSSQKSLAVSAIRSAINLATDKKRIVDSVLQGRGEVIDGPLPQGAGSNTAVSHNFNLERAKEIIGQKEISFTLTTAKTPELVKIAELLKEMWMAAGLKVDIKTFAVSDLEQGVIGPRRYDVFLYGEEVIGENPDPFAFWHSSQRTYPGYNIALYANSGVDTLLEKVRVEQDETKRAALYEKIQNEIKNDLPAVFLFSPHYIYTTPKNLGGADIVMINTASDRFSTVHEWYLKRTYAWKIFLK